MCSAQRNDLRLIQANHSNLIPLCEWCLPTPLSWLEIQTSLHNFTFVLNILHWAASRGSVLLKSPSRALVWGGAISWQLPALVLPLLPQLAGWWLRTMYFCCSPPLARAGFLFGPSLYCPFELARIFSELHFCEGLLSRYQNHILLWNVSLSTLAFFPL